MAKVIYVKTSDTCNLHCDHCFTNGRNGGKTKWDAKKSLAWIKEFESRYPADEQFVIILHGGEPLLADIDDIHWFLDHFDNPSKYIITINTNLVYKLTEERFSVLKRIGFIGTSWDIDVRFETDTQLQLWKSNLARLREEDIGYAFMVTVNKRLIDSDIDWFIDEMESLQPDNVRLERLTVNGNAERNPHIFPDNEEQDNWFVSLYKRYKERYEDLTFAFHTLDTIEDKLSKQIVKTDTNCRNCEQNFVTMNADGSLAGCPNSAEERRHALIEDGVDAFLSSDGRIKEITHELDFNPNCLTCDVFEYCGGDCHKLPWQGDRCGGLKNLIRYIRSDSTNRIDIVQVA